MLLLFRKVGETIYIDTPSGQIKLTVVALYQNGVKIGISAPSDFNIYREELLKQLQQASSSAIESSGQQPIQVEFKTSTLRRLAAKLKTQFEETGANQILDGGGIGEKKQQEKITEQEGATSADNLDDSAAHEKIKLSPKTGVDTESLLEQK